MPKYIQSNVRLKYKPSANPPVLDRIVFTIDHIHMGGNGLYSTYDVVQFLTENRIPVTIFLECTDSNNFCRRDEKNAREIYQLNPDLVSLGVHPLPNGNTQTDQIKRAKLVSDVILNITGKRPVILSYHGVNAGQENGIVFAGIEYARSVKTWKVPQKDKPLDTPVMGTSTVKSSFKYICSRNEFGLSATLFVHSSELTKKHSQKRVFDTLVKNVREGRLQALDYYSAMERDFSANPKCALAHFTNNKISHDLQKGDNDGRSVVAYVSELQAFLNELGFDAGLVDGIFGKKTKMAVLMYQVNNKLEPDGNIGVITRNSINNYCGYFIPVYSRKSSRESLNHEFLGRFVVG